MLRYLMTVGALPWACALSPKSYLPLVLRRSSASVRLFVSSKDGGPTSSLPLTVEALSRKANDFLSYKNTAGSGENDLEPLFEMCAPNADIYGLTGEKIYRPGLTAFFAEHEGLQHELMAEPTCVSSQPAVVQYPFVKSWRAADGKLQQWSSIDPEKPRNKVERLYFDDMGMLQRVVVVEETTSLL